MKPVWIFLIGAALALCVLTCNKHTQDVNPVSYRSDIGQWRQQRLARLTSESRWLTLCGLFWLK
jgi:hypothetical protein